MHSALIINNEKTLVLLFEDVGFLQPDDIHKTLFADSRGPHKSQGVKFIGTPEYIQLDAYLDASGGLNISEGVVISTKVIILSHDWSWLKRVNDIQKYRQRGAFVPVVLGKDSFIGAGAILLPGTTIGCNCIIGAGAVVKGQIPDYSIMAGNPAKVIGKTN